MKLILNTRVDDRYINISFMFKTLSDSSTTSPGKNFGILLKESFFDTELYKSSNLFEWGGMFNEQPVTLCEKSFLILLSIVN